MKQLVGLLSIAVALSACSTSLLKYEKAEELKKIEEFDNAVQIEQTPAPAESVPSAKESPAKEAVTSTPTSEPKAISKRTQPSETKTPAPKKTSKKVTMKAPTAKEPAQPTRQPDLEDSTGFEGRRPLKDPFRVGEEVIHNVHYFKVSAGELRLKVEPFAKVNQRKSYTFAIEINTSSLFSAFYSVDDRVETFVDFEDLVPRVFQLHVKESGQLREAKMLFDTQNNTATFWEKKVTKEDGEQEKKEEWEILPFSQNVYSSVFYMRNFAWEVGKEYSFRVSNEKENLIFSAKALKKEVLNTKIGPMNAIKIEPKVVLKGKFKPIGKNYIWLSDDDRKYILRIESEIKIGTLVSEVIEIKPGR